MSAIVVIVLAAPASRAGDPTLDDCIRGNEQAISLGRYERLREAREQLLVCAAPSCPVEIRDQCERRLIELNASIPTIVFEPKDAAGNDLATVTVSMDGKPLADRLEGTPIAIDPGQHSFHFESPGLVPVDRSFVLHQGEKERHERIAFAAPTPPAAAPVTAPEGGRSDGGPRWPAIAALGAGAAGLVVGSVFGVVALGDANGLKGQAGCPDSCPPSAHSQIDTLHAHQWASDIALGVGVVGVVAGAVLLLTSHATDAARVSRAAEWFDLGAGGAGLRGTF